MSNVSIIAAFGSFIVDLGQPQPSIFATEQEAINALSVFENGAEHRALAEGYCAYNGITGKNAAGKVNVITSFLGWVESGTPAPADAADVGLDVDQSVSGDFNNAFTASLDTGNEDLSEVTF
tara:strand:- start:1658 stop:2023 length:366 start_codon:yes stop_codon:yes gene_type:complete